MKDIQAQMQAMLDASVRDGKEQGLQLVAYVDGQKVVDAWAGVADAASREPVDGETLFPVFSVTKGIAATLAHLLVERGKLDYTTRVAEVWPEFAAGGKHRIQLQHLLDHTAGLPCLPAGITQDDLIDWTRMCDILARARPLTGPGEEQCYHAVSFGWLVGETLRRVDGRPFARMMEEEICRPLGLTGLYVGIPHDVEARVATLDEVFASGAPPPPPDPATPQSIPACMWPLHAWMNRADSRRACLPASNGIMTARSLARHYAALLPGGIDGVELLPPARVRKAASPRTGSRLPVGTAPSYRGLGYGFAGPLDPAGAKVAPFGHGGYGGAMGYADPENRLAVGYTHNRYAPDSATGAILAGLRQALGLAV